MKKRGTIAAIVLLMALIACENRPAGQRAQARLSLIGTLAGADTAGYLRATQPRSFVFPEDYGPHQGYRIEWWYVTGNLASEDGREFGFQFTIFRNALAPSVGQRGSAWATNQAYMGHFAVTDVGRGAFYAYERFDRGALGLAGAEGAPLRVWLGDWILAQEDTAGAFPVRVVASDENVAIDLRLSEGKPVVLQGNGGLSQKGPESGDASYYYSHTRMPSAGTLVIEGDTLSVSGLSWLDREWSTSALSDGQVGWDWFSLQLDDGWEMMIYQLRRADGGSDASSDGVLVDPRGRPVRLDWGRDVVLEATAAWDSPIDGARYPSGWRIRVPSRGWDLQVDPVLRDQELDLAFRYWEGSVRVSGAGENGPVQGRGYVELTGYAGDAPGR